MTIRGAWSSNWPVNALIGSDPLDARYFPNACPLLPVTMTTSSPPFQASLDYAGSFAPSSHYYIIFFSMYPAAIAVLQSVVAV
jgi:hypothetical protein